MKPFRMKVRLYNNRLVRAREEMGLTQADASRAIGVTNSTLSGLETLRLPAWGAFGWTLQAERVAAFYGYSPEYLWPEEIAAVRKNALTLELASADVGVLVSDELEARELVERVRRAKSLLCHADRKLLEARYSDEAPTLAEIAATNKGIKGGDSRERTRGRLLSAERAIIRHLDREEAAEEFRLSQRRMTVPGLYRTDTSQADVADHTDTRNTEKTQ